MKECAFVPKTFINTLTSIFVDKSNKLQDNSHF